MGRASLWMALAAVLLHAAAAERDEDESTGVLSVDDADMRTGAKASVDQSDPQEEDNRYKKILAVLSNTEAVGDSPDLELDSECSIKFDNKLSRNGDPISRLELLCHIMQMKKSDCKLEDVARSLAESGSVPDTATDTDIVKGAMTTLFTLCGEGNECQEAVKRLIRESLYIGVLNDLPTGDDDGLKEHVYKTVEELILRSPEKFYQKYQKAVYARDLKGVDHSDDDDVCGSYNGAVPAATVAEVLRAKAIRKAANEIRDAAIASSKVGKIVTEIASCTNNGMSTLKKLCEEEDAPEAATRQLVKAQNLRKTPSKEAVVAHIKKETCGNNSIKSQCDSIDASRFVSDAGSAKWKPTEKEFEKIKDSFEKKWDNILRNKIRDQLAIDARKLLAKLRLGDTDWDHEQEVKETFEANEVY